MGRRLNMKHEVYIKTHKNQSLRISTQSLEEYALGDPLLPDGMKKRLLGFLLWTSLSDVAEGFFGPRDRDLMLREVDKWFAENIKNDYRVKAFGIKNDVYVSSFFEKEEEAILFKMTFNERLEERVPYSVNKANVIISCTGDFLGY